MRVHTHQATHCQKCNYRYCYLCHYNICPECGTKRTVGSGRWTDKERRENATQQRHQTPATPCFIGWAG
jgi:hypothetical protein